MKTVTLREVPNDERTIAARQNLTATPKMN